MSDEKLYSDRRWNEPLKPRTVGYKAISEDEKAEIDKKMEETLRYFGVLKPNEEFHREDFPSIGEE